MNERQDELRVETSLRDRIGIALLRASWRVSTRVTLTTHPRLDGERFTVPVSGSVKASYHFHQSGYLRSRFSDVHRVLRFALARHPGAVIDVGANVGLILYLKAALDRTRPYLGFEPSARASAYLADFIALNELVDHSVLPVALSSERRLLEFVAHSSTDVMATTVPEVRPRSAAVKISRILAERGDDIIRDWTPYVRCGAALVKIDVEGAELEVLQGMPGVLAEQRPLLVFEMLPLDAGGADQGSADAAATAATYALRRARAEVLQGLLDEAGYRLARMSQSSPFEAVGSLQERSSRHQTEQNYLAYPAVEHASLAPLFERA